MNKSKQILESIQSMQLWRNISETIDPELAAKVAEKEGHKKAFAKLIDPFKTFQVGTIVYATDLIKYIGFYELTKRNGKSVYLSQLNVKFSVSQDGKTASATPLFGDYLNMPPIRRTLTNPEYILLSKKIRAKIWPKDKTHITLSADYVWPFDPDTVPGYLM